MEPGLEIGYAGERACDRDILRIAGRVGPADQARPQHVGDIDNLQAVSGARDQETVAREREAAGGAGNGNARDDTGPTRVGQVDDLHACEEVGHQRVVAGNHDITGEARRAGDVAQPLRRGGIADVDHIQAALPVGDAGQVTRDGDADGVARSVRGQAGRPGPAPRGPPGR